MVDEPNPKIALVCTREYARVLRLVSRMRARRPLAPLARRPSCVPRPAPARNARHTIPACTHRPSRARDALSNARDAHPKKKSTVSLPRSARYPNANSASRPRPLFTATRATHTTTSVPSHSDAVSPLACARAHQPRARRRPPSTTPPTSSSVQKIRFRRPTRASLESGGVVHHSTSRMKTTREVV